MGDENHDLNPLNNYVLSPLFNKIIKSFQMLSLRQWLWVWSAYWRLWLTLLRIKFLKADWLWSNVELSALNEKSSDIEKPQNAAINSIMVMGLALHTAVRIAARLHFMRVSCLPRSLVLVQMLQQRGEAAIVRIGVAKTTQGIASHAWVELGGMMIGEPENVSGDFTPLGRRE